MNAAGVASDGLRTAGVAFVLLAAGLAVLALAATGTPLFLAAPVLLVAALYLVGRPGVALAVLLVLLVLLEDNKQGWLPAQSDFYTDSVLTPIDLLFGVLVAAVLITLAVSRTAPRLPGPLTAPLLFAGFAAAWGFVTGWVEDPTRIAVISQLRPVIYLILMPFLFVNVVHELPAVRKVAFAAGVLAAAKAVSGTIAWVLGQGQAFEGTTITYIGSTANFLLVLFLMVVVAAALMSVPLPTWTKWAFPFALVCFIFSFRRGFWLGAGIALAIVLLLAAGAHGRRMLIPVAALTAAAVWAFGAIGIGAPLPGTVIERGESLVPSKLKTDKEDRYRLSERRNVWEEIRAQPLTGLGIGVPWAADHALPVEHKGGRNYVHFAALYWWLKMGLPGLIAYVWLLATGAWMGFQLWKRHHDGVVRAIGIATCATLFGLAFMETTATFTGTSVRTSVVLGAVLGWLAAAQAVAAPAPARQPAPPPPARERERGGPLLPAPVR